MIRNRDILDAGLPGIELIDEPMRIDGGMTSELLRRALEPGPSIKRVLTQKLQSAPAKDSESPAKPKNDTPKR